MLFQSVQNICQTYKQIRHLSIFIVNFVNIYAQIMQSHWFFFNVGHIVVENHTFHL